MLPRFLLKEVKNLCWIILLFLLPLISKGQGGQSVSTLCALVSAEWKADSNSCNGYRYLNYQKFKNAKPDAFSKEFLFSTLGKPNLIQRLYVGHPERKNYVEYIYYVYKDDCPKIRLEGIGIGFLFDEDEINFVRIEERLFCG